ncbi:MAG: NADH-quinone oxidoreductase subunit J [Pyrinomonadaceae bacterium]
MIIAEYFPVLLFVLFGAFAIGSAISLVVQRNPLYGAISLIGVFIALAGLYVLLAAPFIAAVQIIVYAGAIMVLVVFVIMLLNVEEEEHNLGRLRFLVPVAVALAGVLIAEAAFIIYFVQTSPGRLPDPSTSDVGLTASIGTGLFTTYLLPFEITSVLLLMAIVGAMTLARRAQILPQGARVVPGVQVLTASVVDPRKAGDAHEIETHNTTEAARLLGLKDMHRGKD